MWKGKPDEYSTLHVVGCPVYVMYNSQERAKLDPKYRKCIFLGYANGVRGYRLWDPASCKVIVSRDSVEDDYFEAEPEHGVQELEEPDGIEVRRSTYPKRKPN
ncbi:hypothetical protein KIW84_021691 [Lathyrus oleraceus]|uniref:Retroviral polymerase SH3-like domain-containing protein n=1 Tax=Pisum sativum TaxID=3888 RepID=A0A9D5B8X5_PEA|nr:hypothetical protein KIW84_021691 [Pisum sativum]